MNKRRNYFIKRKFQADFFLKFAALLALEAVVIAALFMFIARGTLTAAYSGAEFTIQKTGAYFFTSFILITFMAGVGIGIAGIFVFMYLSHRLGGPLYKFEKAIEEAERGDLAFRVKLRNTDQLQELKDRMNAFLEALDGRMGSLKKEVEKCRGLIEEGQAGADNGKVKESLRRIAALLDYLKTSG